MERRWQKWHDEGVPGICYYPITTMKDETTNGVMVNPEGKRKPGTAGIPFRIWM